MNATQRHFNEVTSPAVGEEVELSEEKAAELVNNLRDSVRVWGDLAIGHTFSRNCPACKFEAAVRKLVIKSVR